LAPLPRIGLQAAGSWQVNRSLNWWLPSCSAPRSEPFLILRPGLVLGTCNEGARSCVSCHLDDDVIRHAAPWNWWRWRRAPGRRAAAATPSSSIRSPHLISPREVTPPVSAPLSDPEIAAASSRASLAIEVKMTRAAAVAILAGALAGWRRRRRWRRAWIFGYILHPRRRRHAWIFGYILHPL
jgi:hypothetical protein